MISIGRHPQGLPPDLAALDRCLVMGVLNVTPDSFSDGGMHVQRDAAIAHGLRLADAGADLVDVGGESTRPGAARITVAEERDRVLPVVAGLVAAGVHVSVDTMRAEVASDAVAAGACLVNDVSGGLSDPDMLPWVADASVPYVAMHWRGHSTVMEELTSYSDVTGDVRAELELRLDALAVAGVDEARVVLDIGLGFAKTTDQNWALLRDMPEFLSLGHPVLVGASRKRFLGALLATGGSPRPVDQRDRATDAITALAAAAGAWAVRVHDVSASRDAIAVAEAWRRGSSVGVSP